MSTAVLNRPLVVNPPNPQIPAQASSDADVLAMWLDRLSPNTRRAYKADIEAFFAFLGFSDLRQVNARDLSRYQASLGSLTASTASRKLASLKSVFTFAMKIGYLSFNPTVVITFPKKKEDLASRILDKRQVITVIARESNPRNAALLEVLYYSGARISEVVGLNWSDVRADEQGGCLTLMGKGGKTRVVRIPASVIHSLDSIREGRPRTEPVFISRLGRRLSPEQAHRSVQQAARRAGIEGNVSAHWFRHAHASHALDAGAPVHLVQSTLGHSSLATTSRYVHAKPNDSSGLYLSR